MPTDVLIQGRSPIVQAVAPRVFALKDVFANSTTVEISTMLSRVFAHMAEAYIPIILSETDFSQMQLLSLVLTCLRHPSIDVSGKTLHFYVSFLEDITRLEPLAYKNKIRTWITPHVLDVVRTCVATLRYDGEADDERRTYNDEVGDVILECVGAVGLNVVVSTIVEILQGSLSATTEAASVEAGLFALRCVGSQYDCKNTSANSLFDAVCHLHVAPLRIQVAALDFIAHFARCMSPGTATVDASLQFALSGMSNPHLARSAAFAFQRLCVSNAPQLTSSSGLFSRIMSIEHGLETTDALTALQGLAAVITHMDHGSATEALKIVLAPSLHAITSQRFLSHAPSGVLKHS